MSEETANELTPAAGNETVITATVKNFGPNAAVGAFDDFDWSVDKRNVVRYTDAESKMYDEQYSSTLKTIENDEIVKGTVVAITSADVVLNIGFKSDGLVPLTEFRDVEDLAVGMEFDVYVVNKEDKKGILQLSRKNARMLKAWEQIV